MPTIKSAKKALRQSGVRRLLNRSQRAALRNVIKRFRTAAEGDDPTSAETAFRIAVKRIDQAAAKGLIHRNTAARKKSRLSKLLKPVASQG